MCIDTDRLFKWVDTIKHIFTSNMFWEKTQETERKPSNKTNINICLLTGEYLSLFHYLLL